MGIVFDTSKDGLMTVMRDYQEICLRLVWERGEEGVTSGTAWVYVNKVLGKEERSISRASIINFLNDMVEKGVLTYREKSGKGGYHRVYFPAFDEGGLRRHLAETVISKLLSMWPEEVGEILSAFQVLKLRGHACTR